ncbi:MAG: HPF/RaiA family ribosome-associated protein [Bacteroidales bacterium]|nr:HPF/RaiA family ribosome-associated protein [Bacteroidales bacterium]MBK8884864.1 HPF/RaiA family ribosome-associated protein [Bacteroidales bacterium]
MTIQFNTDKNIAASEEFKAPLIIMISEGLSRFSQHITRLEVHLSDENGPKNGVNDKRCMIEARPEGMQPVAVTFHSDSYEQAVEGAIEMLLTSLDTIVRRSQN